MKATSLVLFFLLNLIFVPGLFAQTTKTYTDKKNGFSFKYPSDFALVFGAKAKLETAFGDPGAGVKLLGVAATNIPERYHGSYQFDIWRSSSSKTKCGPPAAEESVGNIPIEAPETKKTKTIGGHTFYAYTGSEGGMSKSFTLRGYRGVVGGKCWQIQSVTYQVSAFEDYKMFDEKIIDKAFQKFVVTFAFTKK